MQLLSIKSIPIQYQITLEHPRLEMRQAQNPRVELDQQRVGLGLRSRDIQIRMDSTEMWASLNLKSVGRAIADNAQKGVQAAQEATADLSRFGTQVGRIDKGVKILDLVAQRVMQQPDTVTVFLPSTGSDISWEPGDLEVEYQPGSLNTDWQVNQNVMNYIPGRFQLEIQQYPRVEITYLGKPQYVPPSSAPDYEAAD